MTMQSLGLIVIVVGCVSIISAWIVLETTTMVSAAGASWVHAMRRKVQAAIQQPESWPSIAPTPSTLLEFVLGWAGFRRFSFHPIVIGCVFIASVIVGAALAGMRGGMLVFLLYGIGSVWIMRRMKQRQRLFRELFPHALDVLSQGLQSGYALSQAIRRTSEEGASPIAEVFRAVDRGLQHRRTLRETLQAVRRELSHPSWDLFVECLAVQERTGGNIIPMIQRVAVTLRQQSAIEQEVHTATASGKMSGMVIALLVPVIFIAFLFLNPAYMSMFFESLFGRLLLGVVIFLEIVGFLTIRKIVSVVY